MPEVKTMYEQMMNAWGDFEKDNLLSEISLDPKPSPQPVIDLANRVLAAIDTSPHYDEREDWRLDAEAVIFFYGPQKSYYPASEEFKERIMRSISGW